MKTYRCRECGYYYKLPSGIHELDGFNCGYGTGVFSVLFVAFLVLSEWGNEIVAWIEMVARAVQL